MYRLLIVDDEELITEGLYDVFSRLLPEQLDVYKAYSGKEALAWMSRTRIDIIVTDISMPGISGIELIEQVQALWPRCKVVFLTGYDHFEYVYKAIQMDDVKYILKAEGYDKVVEAVEEIIIKLDASPHGAKDNLSVQDRYALEMMAQSDLFRYLLTHSQALTKEPDALSKIYQQLGIHFESKDPVYLLLGQAEGLANDPYTEQTKLKQVIMTNWKSHFSENVLTYGVTDRYDDFVFFIQLNTDQALIKDHFFEYIEGTIETFQEDISRSEGINIHMTVSNTWIKWPDVSAKYEALRQLQQLRLGKGYPTITKERDDQPRKNDQNKALRVEHLANALTTNRQETFLSTLDTLLEEIEDLSYQEMVEVYMTVALTLYSYINHAQLQTRIIEADKLMKLDGHQTIKEGFWFIRKIAKQIYELQNDDEKDRTSVTITKIARYIEAHLDEDLSLVKLGEVFYFNPSYLSNFFKVEKGMNVSEYIDQLRISRAKTLLENGELKIKAVSEAVGYHSAHSFTRFFKKHTGLTPKGYRETLSIHPPQS